jgi:hypothetical protein
VRLRAHLPAGPPDGLAHHLSQPTFFAFVRAHFPEQMASYEKRYAQSAFVSAEYKRRVAEVVDSVCREYKLGKRYGESAEDGPPAKPAQAVEMQAWLPFAAGQR